MLNNGMFLISAEIFPHFHGAAFWAEQVNYMLLKEFPSLSFQHLWDDHALSFNLLTSELKVRPACPPSRVCAHATPVPSSRAYFINRVWKMSNGAFLNNPLVNFFWKACTPRWIVLLLGSPPNTYTVLSIFKPLSTTSGHLIFQSITNWECH